MLGEQARQLPDARVDALRRDDLVNVASRVRFLGREEARGEDQSLEPRRAEEIETARVLVHRQAVAQRARDRRAEAGLRGCDPEIARVRDQEPGADGDALDLRDDRLADALQAIDAAIEIALVRQAVFLSAELGELADVRAGHERLAARAAQHEDAHRIVGIDLVAGLIQSLVHAPGDRVARFRTIERHRDDRAVAFDEQLVGHERGLQRSGARILSRR